MKVIKPQINTSLRINLDIVYFIRGSFWATIQQLFGVSSGLVLSYLFGHFVSKSVFGEYNLVLSYVGMLTFLTLPGIDLFLTKSVSLGFEASLISAKSLKFRASLIGTAILTLMGVLNLFTGKNTIAYALLLAAPFFPFVYAYSCYPAFLTAKKKFKLLAMLSILSSIIFVAFHGLVILFYKQTIPLIGAYVSATAIAAIISYTVSLRYIKKQTTSDPQLPGYGSFLTVLSVLPWISGNIGNILLAHFLGVDSLAIFAVASRFLTAVQKNFVVFYKPITAKLAGQSISQHKETMYKHWPIFITMGLLLTTALWIATPTLISFFFSSEYFEAIRMGRLLSLALIPLPLSWMLTDMVMYQKQKKPQILSSTFPQLIKIALYVILIPRFGIIALVGIVLAERFSEPIIPLYFLLKSAHKKQS